MDDLFTPNDAFMGSVFSKCDGDFRPILMFTMAQKYNVCSHMREDISDYQQGPSL